MKQHYEDIDELPVWNFLRIIKTNDLKYLCIGGYMVDEETLKKAWDKIQEQIVDINGISDDTQELIQLQKEIVLGHSEIMLTGDLSELALIQKKEKELLNKASNTGNNMDWLDLITQMEIKFRFEFNLKELSVERLFKRIKEYGKQPNHR